MSTLDWILLAAYFAGLGALIVFTKSRAQSVAGFISAERCAGRYLITVAHGMTGVAAVSIIAGFEIYYASGFCGSWWYLMMIPVGMVIALSGWISYRYRQTRCLTVSQFYGIRYSRRFRIFAGILAFIAGVLNCGIFPGVSARFLMYFLQLPSALSIGVISLPTFPLLMALMIGGALFLALRGGQITIMITDFMQGLILFTGFTIVLVYLMRSIGWNEFFDVLVTAAPEGKSMVHPFRQEDIPQINFWFFAIMAFQRFYAHMAWQGGMGYFSAARTPHEFRMAGILGEWRQQVIFILYATLPVAVWAFLHGAGNPDTVQSIQEVVGQIGDPNIARQMRVPIALSELLPPGFFGLFLIMMIGATISTDDSVYHSWGSVFIQDVVLPIYGRRLEPEQHIRWLRYSIFGVALFAFVWSMIFPLKEYIQMYFQLTGAILIGGAGCVIIGGLYWPRGTTAGAWAGMITGSSLSVTGILLRQFWKFIPVLNGVAEDFPINGTWMSFIAILSAIVVYICVSLLTCREPYDLDKLLHRGQYAVQSDQLDSVGHDLTWYQRVLGITREFSRLDRGIYYAQIFWMLGWGALFIGGTAWNLTHPDVSSAAWVQWWKAYVVIAAVMAIVVVVWFSIGGTRDVYIMLKDIQRREGDEQDDGMVEP